MSPGRGSLTVTFAPAQAYFPYPALHSSKRRFRSQQQDRALAAVSHLIHL